MKRSSMRRSTKPMKRTAFKRKQRQGVRTMKDGRVICSGKAYTELRESVLSRQSGYCADCGRFMLSISDMDLHHPGKGILGGRGMGGQNRDDRNVVGLCNYPNGGCHGKRHKP